MTVLDSPIPRFHLAMPVDDLAAARESYGQVLGLEQGRSAATWIDGHEVPVPHFDLILTEPYVRFEGVTSEQWTMFLLDPVANALEFKAFVDGSQVLAAWCAS